MTLVFTAGLKFTAHGKRSTVFKRVPFRALFTLTSIRVNTTQYGAYNAAYPVETSITGKVKLTTGGLSTIASPTTPCLLPSPSMILADHHSDSM